MHGEEFKKAASRLGLALEIEEPIAKQDFKIKVPPEFFERFYE